MESGQLRVGLVGTGPWAARVHAPGLAEHPSTVLSAVWSRRPEAAQSLAETYDTVAAGRIDELFDQVDAIAFAVPPAVQAEIAPRAAAAGKHLILEKPIAADLPGARRLADAVTEAGVASLVMLTLRFAQETRDWLDGINQAGGWRGGGARWLSGALLGGQYAGSAWRQDPSGGALADIGPHAFDLLDAALGPITEVLAAHRGAEDLWHVLLAHENGATSTATLTLRLPVQPTVAEVAVYGEHGYRRFSRSGTAAESYTALLDDFAAMVSSGISTHPCDVRRGVHLAWIVDRVRALTGR
ncbi:putative dehydrogenase [Amycolatopsis sulphurea]|uniref:Putative dehydrogenase n=1 Tax=Amycolatopsis sulphurea TaxID=76022 RepID=A0A2A9FB74_9PSEU|nr:Gfo/Idh/MocA family oxidoreductase [Amycolatopsis sulphurea]PFG48604.1 putative dehydrogenase [Amycolatopsis sulphurea]